MGGYFVNRLEPAVSIFVSSAFCKLISFDRVNRDIFSWLIVRSKFVTSVMSVPNSDVVRNFSSSSIAFNCFLEESVLSD